MAGLNKVIIMGRLTRDPELRYIPSGTAVADLGVALNERYRDKKTNELKEIVTFVDVAIWARQAETAAEYLSKGSNVFIEGRLQMDEWETKDGNKRSKLRIRADNVQFLDSPRRSEMADTADSVSSPEQANTAAPESDPDDIPF